ncbi:MAG: adenylosuccinate lyase [Candidatus Latescibacteria bacterium 4484_181]|nr:MAG: adenylosuccinate lyase [Candidatus Latescibacteria bacterium 4484_181]RKY74072.1 MAG: adenylosuccinate lyase [Candidatus Latescibacterota bacterium]
MIERYTLPEMGAIWSLERKFQLWLEIELLACEAWTKLRVIPEGALREIKRKAKIDVARIQQIEQQTRHDFIAFLTNLSENVGQEARFIHLGLTSYDVEDNALSLRMRQAADVLIDRLEKLGGSIRSKAIQYKMTPMIGRTHGVHAEPTTFGLKMALWYDEVGRNIRRLKQAREVISYGKVSGAVGTMAQVDPFVESYVCEKLGLTPAPVSTQILQRDRHAEYMAALAITACSLEKFATEIRNLQRTEILEAEEGFKKGQKGSSAMPHKRNPIVCERITGLARVVRSNLLAALENISLWHERDLTNSSVERVIIPDSAILLDYMLTKLTEVIGNLLVYPENMMKNVLKTKGLIFSQRVLLELVKKGLSREQAYDLVQQNAMKSWHRDQDFKQLLLADKEVRSQLAPEEIERCFNLEEQLKNVDFIFRKAGIQ